MTDDGYLMVDFYQHCSTCEHEKLNGWEDPCNECLEHAMNLGVVFGTLSSIFIASPVAYLVLGKKIEEKYDHASNTPDAVEVKE